MFDSEFYRTQLPESTSPGTDLVEHYLAIGSDAGISPHPLFDPKYYLAKAEQARRSAADPYIEFLTNGVQRLDDPHSLFDTKAYAALMPEAATHRFGPFGHFHDSTGPWPLPQVMQGKVTSGRGYASYVELVKGAMAAHFSVADFTDVPRLFSDIDQWTANNLITKMRAVAATIPDPPIVSVILPTMDRWESLKEAIASVFDQTYPHWELIVIDDGGTDDTEAQLQQLAAREPRVKYIWQHNTGVSGARNHGIRIASGKYVAFLDSDNTWVPEFLETMIGFLAHHQLRLAYSSSELRGRESPYYRGRPFTRGALLERNYIDCITIVVERDLLSEIGSFDERLRRVGDWDLLIRLTAITEPAHAPFIGTSYEQWNTSTIDRITRTESGGFRQVVLDKHLRPSDPAQILRGKTSCVMVVSEPGRLGLDSSVALLAELADQGDHELILIDNGLSYENAIRLRLLERMHNSIIVGRFPEPVSQAVACNWAAYKASGDVLLFVNPLIRITGTSVERLAHTVRAHAPALAQPAIVERSGTVYSAGQLLGPRGSVMVWAHGAAFDDPILAEREVVDGPDGVCFAIDCSLYRTLDGMNPIYLNGGSDIDLGLRGHAEGASTFMVHESIARLISKQTPKNLWSPDLMDRAEFRKRWSDLAGQACHEGAEAFGVVIGHPMPSEAPLDPTRWTGNIRRSRQNRRWAIKTSVPDLAVAPTWGDWHFASDLKRALDRVGEEAVVDTAIAWHRPTASSDDINLVLRGTRRYIPNPSQINILWVISHPELLTLDEVTDYDMVFVASEVFPSKVPSTWKEIRLYSLLQCTDPSRFYPEPDSSLDLDVLFVGNSRNVMRPAVSEAIRLGLNLSVYGSGWEKLIPADYVKSEYLPNEELHRYYSSAQIVLNDHWDDMRLNGFISNRIFDAVASGAVVVSDHIPGLDQDFGEQVVTFKTKLDFPAAIARARSIRARSSELPAIVSAEHSFAARAQRLISAVEEVIETRSRSFRRDRQSSPTP